MSVVDVIRHGKFHIWPVCAIDEGIEVLSGVKAGKRRSDGAFEPKSINALVNQRLIEMAETIKRFSTQEGHTPEEVD